MWAESRSLKKKNARASGLTPSNWLTAKASVKFFYFCYILSFESVDQSCWPTFFES